MAKSKITLTFDNIVYGNNITLLLRLNGNVVNIMTEAFVTQRVGSSQVSLGTTTPTDNYLMTDEFKKAFDADYNTTNLFSLGQVGNTLEITCNYDYYTFELGSSENIGVSIENGTFTPDITIDNISFNVPSGDECSNTEVSVTTSEQVVNMTSPMSQSISNNPFVFEWQRGQTFSLEVDNGVKTAIKQVNTPSLLIAPSVNTLNNPSGATVSIFTQTSPASKDGLTFEYSLDGTTFKSSNVFTGILSGVYTAYVRDNFGCVKTTQFEVSELETNESLTPYHYYPQSNPIRTAIRESWDIYGKNDENTLSCEEEVPLVKPWNHLKQTNDFDTIQIRSNYNQVNVTIIDGVNQDVVSADKVSNYIGYKDKRDGKIFQRNNGKAGLYFEIGKTYDYDSGEDLNNDYFLNGSLPEWGKSGNYIFLDGIGFFQITGKIFDNDKNAWVLSALIV